MGNVYSIHPENPQKVLIQRATECLRDGGVIIYPTDTVYGIGCDITQKKALERIVEIKRRNLKKPFSFICKDLKQVGHYATITDFAYPILKRFLPGPYTFILPANRHLPRLLLGKRKTVGIRIPKHNVPIALVESLGTPIVSTSANTPGGEIIKKPEELADVYGNLVDMILECGALESEPSTIISLIDDRIEIIREGAGDVSYFK
ncbi:MAG: threonylcarbamoyl-AMP synthase [Nitrospirae bacterium]|nr:MAG: threonylcarbamoyl-AMP synthase [Nitrospirota bacterium]